MTRFFNFLLAVLLLFTLACEQPMDPVVESVVETNNVLQAYNWVLTDYEVVVKNKDIPPPVLLNLSDSLIEAGNYHLNDMIPPGTDFTKYIIQFTNDKKILVDSANTGDFIDQGGSYFVFNDRNIRLNPSGVKKEIYNYYYNSDQQSISFTLTEEAASRAIDNVNENLSNWVVNQTPNKIGDAIAQKVATSQKLQQSVHDFLVNAIAGKLSDITDFNPENTADTLAGMIISSIDSVNWQSVLSVAINTELQKITDINADSLAPIIAQNIADEIQSVFGVDNIYNIVLPYMDGLASQDPETMANNIATLITQALGDVFDEQHLQQIITPLWRKFTKLDTTKVETIAAKFTEIVQANWLNADTLSTVFLPFTEKIDETPLIQLNNLAQQTTDSLEVHITQLNETFPDFNLTPDYNQIETQIHAILIAAKPVISTIGPDTVAMDIAQMLLNNFLTTDNIQNVFVSAINYLQSIDPATAATTIAGWLVNIQQRLEPELIEWLTDKLSPIIQNFDPEYTAFKIAEKVNDFVNEHFSEENIESKVLPMLQKITDVNTEALANLIAKTILNSSLVQNGITQENIASKLLPLLQDINNIDPQGVSEQIVEALGDVFKNHFSPDRLSNIIAFLLYKEAWNNFKIANNFQEATIIFRYE